MSNKTAQIYGYECHNDSANLLELENDLTDTIALEDFVVTFSIEVEDAEHNRTMFVVDFAMAETYENRAYTGYDMRADDGGYNPRSGDGLYDLVDILGDSDEKVDLFAEMKAIAEKEARKEITRLSQDSINFKNYDEEIKDSE